MTVQLSPFAQAAPILIGLGFHPVPILPPTAAHGGKGKAPGDFVMGSWRGMSKWQALRDAPPSDWQMNLWTRYAGANVGVVMGSPAGGDLHVISVDVDTLDPDELRDILGALPASPMVKRGAKGETRFYRAAKAIKTAVYDKAPGATGKPVRLVDLLCGFDTRQTVCPPSVHPDGQVYVWTAGPVAALDLPEFTSDHLSELEETLEACGWVRGGAARPARDRPVGAPLPDADDFFTETKAAALANMDAWVHDLDVYGLRPARGGYEAVATWRPSSTGRPIADRKLNLSIQAEGIKDFGTNWTGSAIDLVMCAQNLQQAEATSWLRLRLGLTGETMLLDQRPASAPAPVSGSAFTPDAAQEAPDHQPDPMLATPRPKGSATETELPDRLTHPPGLVGLITDWITDTGTRPQRGLALGAALALVGTAAGRKFGGPTDSGTHLYVLALAATGAGKEAPLQAISRILDASAMGQHVGPPQFMSMSSVVSTLKTKPLSLCPMDEFGSFLARVNSKKAGGHERAISGALRSAWGASFGTFMTPAWADRESTKIIAPAMSLYAASTHEEFYAAIEGGDVYNGFLNRFLTISTKLKPPKRKRLADQFDVPEPIASGMTAIYNEGGLLGATSHVSQADRPPINVPWDHAQAERVYDRLDEEIEERESEAAFLSRTAEMAVRMATIIAIGRNHSSPRVTVEDMEWGRDVALWSAERMIEDAGDYLSENERQSDAQKVVRLIKARGRIKKTDLGRAMQHKLNSRALADLVQGLVDSGEIVAQMERPPSGGTAVTWYTKP